jgi:hypothetical protein
MATLKSGLAAILLLEQIASWSGSTGVSSRKILLSGGDVNNRGRRLSPWVLAGSTTRHHLDDDLRLALFEDGGGDIEDEQDDQDVDQRDDVDDRRRRGFPGELHGG